MSHRYWFPLLALLACGDSGGTPDASLPDATVDAPTADAPVTDAGSDVISDAGSDAPLTGCQARKTDDLTGVYVSTASGADSSGCGTRTIPCKTIQKGISQATQGSGKTTVYVASGAYVESVTLAAGITVEGGWNVSSLTWTPICDGTTSTAVSIQGVTNTTITASFSGAGTLRDLQVTSKASTDPSESLYGIFASGSSTDLTLEQVVVNVGGGGPGVDGVNGDAGASATDAGCAASNGANGGSGSAGAGGATGTFTSTGYVSTDGTSGANGGAGHNGTAGGTGACATCQTFTGSCPNSCGFGSVNRCAGNGISGCGGAGGTGGTLGTGGGASVALYVWDAHVTVFGGSYSTGNGGNGGSGGSGADGGSGTAGGAGANASCPTSLSNPTCFLNSCTGTLNSSTTLNGGSAGGSGGAGGAGGAGGGGGGGWSYAVVAGGDGGVSVDGGVLAHGDAGTGGTVGGANGQAGDKWP